MILLHKTTKLALPLFLVIIQPPNNLLGIHFILVLLLTFQSLTVTNELSQLQDRHWRSLLQPPGLAGTPSMGYIRGAVTLWWYYMRQASPASWLPPQTMERNEVLRAHPPSKMISLHPAMPSGLLDAVPTRPFQATAVLFLLLSSLVSTQRPYLQVSPQQLIAHHCAPCASVKRRKALASPDWIILLDLLLTASVMMTTVRIITPSSHSTSGITDLDITSNLWFHPLLHCNVITYIGTLFDKPHYNFKINLPYTHACLNITIIPYCYFHHKSIQLSVISIHRMVITSIYSMALASTYSMTTAKQELRNPKFKSSSKTCRVLITLALPMLYQPLVIIPTPSQFSTIPAQAILLQVSVLRSLVTWFTSFIKFRVFRF